jgi:hypothetical protein
MLERLQQSGKKNRKQKSSDTVLLIVSGCWPNGPSLPKVKKSEHLLLSYGIVVASAERHINVDVAPA